MQKKEKKGRTGIGLYVGTQVDADHREDLIRLFIKMKGMRYAAAQIMPLTADGKGIASGAAGCMGTLTSRVANIPRHGIKQIHSVKKMAEGGPGCAQKVNCNPDVLLAQAVNMIMT